MCSRLTLKKRTIAARSAAASWVRTARTKRRSAETRRRACAASGPRASACRSRSPTAPTVSATVRAALAPHAWTGAPVRRPTIVGGEASARPRSAAARASIRVAMARSVRAATTGHDAGALERATGAAITAAAGGGAGSRSPHAASASAHAAASPVAIGARIHMAARLARRPQSAVNARFACRCAARCSARRTG
jgi:hypothetical protein